MIQLYKKVHLPLDIFDLKVEAAKLKGEFFDQLIFAMHIERED